jgi:glycosyltransferase involved in cell wall biosynthesis
MSSVDHRSGGPLVSVVIPTYNRAEYIAETIESVLQQTYSNLEVIVIDDGSTDDTANVVAAFAPKVRYVWQENSERGASRNHGLRLASGDYIAFLDSDDLWLPDKVASDLEIIAPDPGIGVVYTDSLQIDAAGRELRIVRAAGPSGDVTSDLLLRNFVSMGCHLVRTEAIRSIDGFREERELAGAEDWEMWVRLSLATRFAYNPVATTKIRTHDQNTMTNPVAMQRSLGRAAELLHESVPLSSRYRKRLKRMDAMVALVNAINYCTQGEKPRSREFLKNALVADPKILLDPRFGYTIFRLLKGGSASRSPLPQADRATQ